MTLFDASRALGIGLALVVLPPFAAQNGWRHIRLDGAECAFGTPYSFFYRPGPDPSRLLIWFEGGGACWDPVSCSGLFDSTVSDDELASYRGIFDVSNPDNPFREYAMVFIPYCTGDVHIGSADRRYGGETGGRTVAHHGAANVGRTLAWATSHLDAPGRIVIAGASAGSYGALFNAPRIAKLFPSADLFTIGDSGVPLLPGYESVLDGWGAGAVLRSAWDAPPDAPLTLERAWHEAARLPRMRAVVAVMSDQDRIQSAFYLVAGSSAWREDSYALLDRVERANAGVHSFVVAGPDHGLLRTDAFYRYEADGTLLVTWIGRLLDGAPIEDVRCSGCVITR
jgi:hypothetical protein